LKPGDVLFFIPQQRSYPRNLSPYHFTGVLTCAKKIDSGSLGEFEGISSEYAKRYRRSLAEHLDMDKPKTKAIRRSSVVIGIQDSKSSRWFGDAPVPVQPLLREMNLSKQLKNLRERNNAIPSLNTAQTRQLLARVLSLTSASAGMGPFPPTNGGGRCTSCHH